MKKTAAFAALLLIVSLFACPIVANADENTLTASNGGSRSANISAQASAKRPAISITRVSSGSIKLKKGAIYKIGAKATSGKLSFKSSRPKTVAVTKRGALKANKPGKAIVTITAESGPSKSSKKIRVAVLKKGKFVNLKKMKMSVSSKKIQVGKTSRVTLTYSPKKASNRNVVFKSSNSKIASVSPTGVITAKKKGTARITATSCNSKRVKASTKIVVEQSTGILDVAVSARTERISAYDAKVSSDGKTAVIKQGALSQTPAKNDIVLIVDDYMQGTAIKVNRALLNSDGSYKITGSEPAFSEVFDKLKMADIDKYEMSNTTYLANGATLKTASAIGTQSNSGSVKPGTLKFTLTKKFFEEKLGGHFSLSGNIEVSVTPSIEYDFDYEFGKVNRLKMLTHFDSSVSGMATAGAEAKIPLWKGGGFATALDVYVVVGIDGSISLAYEATRASGIDYQYGRVGDPFVDNAKAAGAFELSATGRTGIGAEASLSLVSWRLTSASLEGGARANVEIANRANGLSCADANAWAYAEFGCEIFDPIASLCGIQSTRTWELWDRGNSPLKVSLHFENGKRVDNCSWPLSNDGPSHDENVPSSVSASSYVVDIPAYWRGKVHVDVDGDDIVIMANGFENDGSRWPQGILARMSTESTTAGNTLWFIPEKATTTDGKTIYSSAINYKYYAFQRENNEHCSYLIDSYSRDGLDSLIKLQTGGACGYDQAANGDVDRAQTIRFYADNLWSTIRMR